MIYWNLEEKRLDLAYTWKISRNESTYKNNFFIHLTDNETTGIGEVAPNIRYGETAEKIRSEFDLFKKSHSENITSLNQLTPLLNELNLSNSLRFGIESAFIHWLCKKQKVSIYQLLNIPLPGPVYTSYTIPIMDPSSVKEFIDKYRLKRFHSLKIKINEDGLDLVKEVSNNYQGPLRIDANEAWSDVERLIPFIEKLKEMNVEFVEQPLPQAMINEYIYLKKQSVLPLIGDESITNSADFEILKKQFHGINIKLMKAGGYINGRDLLLNAQKHGMQTMIGCMIETTLGISSGIHLCGLTNYADLDGHFVLSNDPFNLVKEIEGRLEIGGNSPEI